MSLLGGKRDQDTSCLAKSIENASNHHSEYHALDLPVVNKDPAIATSFCQNYRLALSSAFVTSIAYIDPGSMASAIQSGANFGLVLLWVILLSSLIAMLFQVLSSKIGLATGKSLPELIRDMWPRPIVLSCWIAAEMSVFVCEISEFIGAAIAYKLLFGVSMAIGGVLTALTTLFLLVLHQSKAVYFRATIFILLLMIIACFIIDTALSKEHWDQVAYHSIVPSFNGTDCVVNAVGILGATVTPYAIFLHSELVKNRIEISTASAPVLKFEIIGIIIALGIAEVVNSAILTLSASTFYGVEREKMDVMENAYKILEPLLGTSSKIVFGIGLLASGISSSAVGTLAGHSISTGFSDIPINVYIRWLFTVAPCIGILFGGFAPMQVLTLCNVVGSFCVPFCLVPVVWFTSQKKTMGLWVNSTTLTLLSALLTLLVIAVNLYLVFSMLSA